MLINIFSIIKLEYWVYFINGLIRVYLTENRIYILKEKRYKKTVLEKLDFYVNMEK